MPVRFNEKALLWALGTLQPASVGDAILFLGEIFPDVRPLPKVKDLDGQVTRWVEEGYLTRVHGKSRLYSVTSLGNEQMPAPLRRYRDRVRIFLLKSCRDAKLTVSGGSQQGLAGDPPAVDGSSSIQEGSRPKASAAIPRGPRNIGRSFWPRVVKQLTFEVGSEARSPDAFLEYYSFPTLSLIHKASNNPAGDADLSVSDLSLAIGISPRLLTLFTHKPESHYREFDIGKRGGGKRTISSPKTFLKIVQHWLLDYLFWRLPTHHACHSYQSGRSIITNSAPHVAQKYVANIDIQNFFGSITTTMVSELLRAHGFGPQLMRTASRLVTLKGALPQGAPTSPIISNTFLFDFDENMTDEAGRAGLVYTRYADDITISGSSREAIAEAISYSEKLLGHKGLQLNAKKTRIASQGSQQKVTGVVVNKKLQPPRALRRRIRAMFHEADIQPAEFTGQLAQLRGYLSYLRSFPALRDSKELERYATIIRKLKT